LALELGDQVLEHEFALLQALDLELVEGRLLADARDRVVEIAVLDLQLLHTRLDCFEVEVHRQRQFAAFVVKNQVYQTKLGEAMRNPIPGRGGGDHTVAGAVDRMVAWLKSILVRTARGLGILQGDG